MALISRRIQDGKLNQNMTLNKKIIVISYLLAIVGGSQAQSILDKGHLAFVKSHLEAPAYQTALKALVRRADKDLMMRPVSVMDKTYVPSSGSKHDYVSLARYAWPDENTANGLPYIMRDGVSNPELNAYDRNRLSAMSGAVTRLSLTYYFTGQERYAAKASQLLRTWFLDKSTRMNPNLRYAQQVPGVAEGRCYGVLDAYSFIGMLDGVHLLEASKSFTDSDAKQLRAWFARLLHWLQTNPQAREESYGQNNHSIAYDAQVAAYALYTGNKSVFNRVLKEFPQRRIAVQINPDGSMPHELSRTLAFGYSQYNLTHIIDLLLMAKHQGLDIRQYAVSGNHSFFKAMDFLAPYIGKDVSAWPYQQISGWNEKQQELCKDYYRAWLLDNTHTDYLRLFRQHYVRDWSDSFVLLYEKPTKEDQAMARAEKQLRYALRCVSAARKTAKDHRVSPRSMARDSSLVLVAPSDWCAGFFPGNLWQMYEYTHNPEWREQAVSNTWLIENAKTHSTHDLGFIFNSSFGKAYALTGEQSFRYVLLRAAQTLSHRFSPKTGCIRSWDFNRDRWEYPVIIDNMMNLELLFKATQLTGDSSYYKIAVSHANTTMRNHFRPDGSCYHVVDYDSITGKVRMRVTYQGYSDDSYWSRGQGWALYGFTMCYRFTHDVRYLEQARRVAKFLLSLKNVPADGIYYWDMKDPAIPNAPRDASAAAVIASALYELSKDVDGIEARSYRACADKILNSLIDHYQSPLNKSQGFLLLHSVGHKPGNSEIDVPIVYADYYYLEALRRKAALTIAR